MTNLMILLFNLLSIYELNNTNNDLNIFFNISIQTLTACFLVSRVFMNNTIFGFYLDEVAHFNRSISSLIVNFVIHCVMLHLVNR